MKPIAMVRHKRNIAGRAWGLRDIGKGNAERKQCEKCERTGEDIEVASHRASSKDSAVRSGLRGGLKEGFDLADILGKGVGRERLEEGAAVALALDAGV